ncbi:hybrid sensor histidine kinase/response regulator, partial [Pseudomonas sp. MWU12-2534b]
KGTRDERYVARSVAQAAVEGVGAVAQENAGQERLAVDEDETDVRSAEGGMVEHEGYQVCSAASGDADMQLLLQGLAVDLIFTDVVMPGQIKSTDLATWARTQRPPAALMFTSENTLYRFGRNDHRSPIIRLWSAPYAREDGGGKIRSLLGG